MTDEELAAAAAAGDENAFATLFSRHHDSLVRESRRRLNGDWNTAEEIAQATWVKAHLNLASFDPNIRPFISWLHCIRARLLIDYTRAKHVNACVEFADDLVAVPLQDDGDEAECLAHALDELPSHLRDAIQATYLEERSFPDAARVLGCSLGCVHKRTVIAIRLLREKLNAPKSLTVKRLIQTKRKPRGGPALSTHEIQMLVA